MYAVEFRAGVLVGERDRESSDDDRLRLILVGGRQLAIASLVYKIDTTAIEAIQLGCVC